MKRETEIRTGNGSIFRIDNDDTAPTNDATVDDDNVVPGDFFSASNTTESPSLSLMDCGSDIFRNTLSFLTLQEALTLANTCRQWNNNDNTNALFRYACIVDSKTLTRLKVGGEDDCFKYLRIQTKIIRKASRTNVERMNAILRNETFLPNVNEIYGL